MGQHEGHDFKPEGKVVMESSSLCLLLGICLRLVHDALSAQGRRPLVVGRHIIPVRQEHVLCPAQLLLSIMVVWWPTFLVESHFF